MTPLKNPEQEQEIIQHLHEGHHEGVMNLAYTFVSPQTQHAQLKHIFEEGILIQSDMQEKFIPFMLKNAEIREQIYYLIFYARVQQGAFIDGNDYRYFTVLKNQKISPNMQRLTLHSSMPMPTHESGLAWYFTLQSLGQMPNNPKISKLKQWFHQFILKLLPYFNAQQRHQILDNFYKNKRYYTVQKFKKSSENQNFNDIAIVDVFIHGDTLGSQWARGLREGDVVRSTAEYREQTAHLHEGQALLMGDETALPTILSLLENWQNPIAPIVISITDNPDDQMYLPDNFLPEKTRLFRISSQGNFIQNITDCLQKNAPKMEIDTVWAAMEANDANQIRAFLKEQFDLSGKNIKNIKVKGYWRKT